LKKLLLTVILNYFGNSRIITCIFSRGYCTTFAGMCSCKLPEDSNKKLVVKSFAEFLGAFFLTHSIVFSVNFDQELAALAIGSTLMICIYAWGHVSGA